MDHDNQGTFRTEKPDIQICQHKRMILLLTFDLLEYDHNHNVMTSIILTRGRVRGFIA